MEEQSTRTEERCRNNGRNRQGGTNEQSSIAAQGRSYGIICREHEEGLKSRINSGSSSFECNICLESATDPVVTLCGHLFCWPCIYRWLCVSDACPVCKAPAKEETLIPLYGRGSTKPQLGNIPNRPTPTHVTHSTTSPGDQPYPYPYPSSFNQNGFNTALLPAGYELSPFFAFQCSSVGQSLPHNRHHQVFLHKLFIFVSCFVFVCLLSF